MITYKWAKIYRKSLGLSNIILKNATVHPSDNVENFVSVTGKQKIEVETKYQSQMPTRTIAEDLHPWDPRRLFGIKTRDVEVTYIPDEYEYVTIVPRTINNWEGIYAKFVWEERTYRINQTWLELSADTIDE